MNFLRRDDETLDRFYHGKILILQKKRGYRFSVDAPLLADFIRTEKTDRLLELGAGSGIISLLLSIKPFKEITAVEVQESLADLARRNVKLNSLESRITVVHRDLRKFISDQRFDIVFSNPPYIKKDGGHLSVFEEKRIAKHEIKCDIFDIMRRASELLKVTGRACFIFPEKRRDEFMRAAEEHGLKMKTIRMVFPGPDSEPNLFLSEYDFASEEMRIMPPFVLFDKNGEYTAEAKKIFAGRAYVPFPE